MSQIEVPDWVVEAAVDEIRLAKHTCFDRWTDQQAMRAALTAALGAWVVPVGQAGTMPGTVGFTMAAFKTIDVGVAQPLYTLRQEKPE